MGQPGAQSGLLFLSFLLFPDHFTFPVFFFISQQSLLEERVLPGRMCKENVGRSSLFIVILGTRGVCLNSVGKGEKSLEKRERRNVQFLLLLYQGWIQDAEFFTVLTKCYSLLLLLSVFCTIFLQYIPEWLQGKKNPF